MSSLLLYHSFCNGHLSAYCNLVRFLQGEVVITLGCDGDLQQHGNLAIQLTNLSKQMWEWDFQLCHSRRGSKVYSWQTTTAQPDKAQISLTSALWGPSRAMQEETRSMATCQILACAQYKHFNFISAYSTIIPQISGYFQLILHAQNQSANTGISIVEACNKLDHRELFPACPNHSQGTNLDFLL